MTNKDNNKKNKFVEDLSKFFGRRSGKTLRRARRRLVDELLPKNSIDVSELGDDEFLSIKETFPEIKSNELWLEVGFGGGEHLATQSQNNPDICFIGGEVFLNGVASFLAHVTGHHEEGATDDEEIKLLESRTDNVRVYADDIRLLLPHLPDGCVSKFFVLFPDPWPKKRHALRRFIGPENLPEITRLIKKGGELRIASDDMNYIRWSLRHLMNCEDFTWTAETSEDWKVRPSDWVATRYEQKALAKGDKPVYLRFRRI
ncbi:MAG: tRNA (guanosine(46)-N7)-methyltransferase TrmB [Alphaproteobacteria bacterium]|nr:tRNA (guanosine(46)-N7)-methyltransferase TrmB [Alphaproteobacteria bacterium]